MDFYLHPEGLIQSLIQVGIAFAYLGIFAIVFAESGLFFGFFLPGDSLLLTAGLLAFRGDLNLLILMPVVFVAAILGDNVGYWFGNKAGPLIFRREESRLFKPRNLRKAKEFYDRYGGITIVLARFMPFIRTFAPIVAGAANMNYGRFFFFNMIGGVLWGIGVTLVGYLIGRVLGAFFPAEQVDKYFLVIVVVVIALSALPTLIHLWREHGGEILARVRGQPYEKREHEPGA